MLHYYKKHTPEESFQSIRTLVDGAWIHVSEPNGEELRDLAKQYGLDEHILRDVNDKNELPRTEYSDGSQYVFVRPALRTAQGEVASSPFLAVLTPDHFITVSPGDALTAHGIMSAGAESRITTDNKPAMLLLTMNTVVAHYENLIQYTDRYIKGIRRKLQSHEVSNRDFVHFVTVEDNLNEYQYSLQDTLVLLERLKDNSHSLFNEDELEQLEDTRLYCKQLLSSVSSHSQSITSIRNAYSTIANNTLNQRMKALTMLTVLIALPNVFYGMYGMNVHLPFQDSSWAYGAIVVFTVLVIFAVYAIAKRFKVF